MRLVSALTACVAAASFIAIAQPASAEGKVLHPHGPHEGWEFEGPFGTFDQNALQRGYKVYREVCASCHGMKLLSFRNLGQKGAPFFDEAYPDENSNPKVKQIASEYMVAAFDEETGDPIQVAATTVTAFPSPYANEAAARGSNGGALPPDLSVITKARHGGASYIYSLLTGYVSPPAGLTVSPGLYYNPFFPGDTKPQWAGDPREAPAGGFLAMAPPLREGLVVFDDGTASTVEQMSADVATFLAWAGEPKAETRRMMGFSVIGYLLIMAGLTYASYRRIWRNIQH
ncbi:cytochrome c1 [bacterium]|nr:cytochrome c1 [bacterium]